MWNFARQVLMALFGGVFCLAIPLNAEENHAGELGYCALCNTVIMERVDFHIKPNEQYNELMFEFSNGSKGRIAFCDKHYMELDECQDGISEDCLTEIMDGIKRGWEKEFMLRKWPEEKIQKYKDDFFGVKIIRRINDEEMVVQ